MPKVVSRSSGAPGKALGDDYGVSSSKDSLKQKKDALVNSFQDKYGHLKEYGAVNKGLTVLKDVIQGKDCYDAMSAKISEMQIPKGMVIRLSFGPGEKKVSLVPIGDEIKNRGDVMALLQKTINLLSSHVEKNFTDFEPENAKRT